MPVLNQGFGGTAVAGSASVQGYNSVTGSIKEYIPHKFSLLFNTASKVVSSGALKKTKGKNGEITITVVPPCTEDVTWGRDFSRWPTGSAVQPVKMRIPPTQILAKVSLGIAAADMDLADSSSANYLGTLLDARLKQCSLQLARGIFGGTASPVATNLNNWSAVTASTATVTLDFFDVSLFKENASYDLVQNATPTIANTVRCIQIVRQAVTSGTTASANVAGRVTFQNDVPNPSTNLPIALGSVTSAVTDVFYPRGTFKGFGALISLGGDALTSFTDIATAATLQSQTASGLPGWTGNTLAAGSLYNQEIVSAFAGRIEAVSGESPSHYFCSPQLVRAHGASFQQVGSVFGITGGLSNGSTPKPVQADVSKYSMKTQYMLNDAPLIPDISCPADTLVAHNDDHVFLGEYREIGPVTQGGEPLMTDQSFVAQNYFLSGQYQLYTNMRCSVGTITGFTGL